MDEAGEIMPNNYEAAYYALYVGTASLYDQMRQEYPDRKADPAWEECQGRLLYALAISDLAMQCPVWRQAEWELQYRELREKHEE